MRALAYYAASMIDRGRRDPDAEKRSEAQRRADLLIPVVKAWCTDLAVAVASTGIQVHGGMGYVEEAGAAQYLRDARIGPIYEGTNGIQANDLVGRKLSCDEGAAARALIEDVRKTVAAMERRQPAAFTSIAGALDQAIATLEAATAHLIEAEPARAAAGSVPYLTLLGTVSAGWLMAREALAADDRVATDRQDASFLRTKLVTARFYAEHFLALAPGYLPGIAGGGTVLDCDAARF
jgi:3-(methylthio)propanoyl-CoA dehydrogenase